ncbi:FCD domain-containing protein [Aeromicrobium sp. SMF47]|uniref:GntR family transcriptional regulator n=1 Tax=Aeromicrobium TaxID=2040 RepID=UPI00129E274E|nr:MULTISPECIES: GntR family transcriptional regulator [Aeromicrobium]MRJ75787.1 FCD domain-containing protein [Aeromicrobium yanjiei]
MSDGNGTELSRDGTFSRRTETLVREMILSGTVAPGERLNEVALAASLGISRGPLREAIQHLAGEGLLTIVSHRGAFVRTFDPRELDELYDMRTAFEMYAARLACQRAADEDLAALQAFVSETAEAMSSESGGSYPPDRDFHQRLLALASNATLERAALETQAQIYLARSMSAKAPVRAKEALQEHADIVTALQSRSPDEAAQLVYQHLDRARRSALAALGFDDESRRGSEKS